MGFFRQEYLEWVAIPFSRRSSLPRDWTWVSPIAGRFFTTWANREVHFSLLMFTHRSTEANLFNGINLLSHHIVNNTFSQLGEDHSEGSFSDDVAPDEIERGFPCNRLRRQPHSPSPEKRSLSVFFLFYCMSPGEDPWDTQGSIPQENLGTPPPMLKAWGKAWHTTPVFLPGKSQGQRRLVGYSLQGHKELDTTEHAGMHTQSG